MQQTGRPTELAKGQAFRIAEYGPTFEFMSYDRARQWLVYADPRTPSARPHTALVADWQRLYV